MSSISLACNFKNEVENVRRIFNCVESVVSEIVVVDCGSTDGTRELCRKLGARVYDIGDCPGYGSMRTITLHLCKTDWAIFLDGDEMMDPQDVANSLFWLPSIKTRTQMPFYFQGCTIEPGIDRYARTLIYLFMRIGRNAL